MSLVAAMTSALVVLDFDYTLINVNSDTFVVEKLSPEVGEALERLKKASKQNLWTAGMDHEMSCLHKNGVSLKQIEACLATVSIDPALKEVLSQIAEQGSEIRVLSDANTMFIDVILRANGLDRVISRVVTNPSSESGGQLRVFPYHTTPHPAHSTSPPNLCKGRVMQEWLAEKEWKRVIYCGDGGGDFEGAISVPAGGTICARKDWSLHKKLQERIAGGTAVRGDIQTWETQPELAALLGAS